MMKLKHTHTRTGTPLLYMFMLWQKRRILRNPPPTPKACAVQNLEEDYITFHRKRNGKQLDQNFTVTTLHGLQIDLKGFDDKSGIYLVRHGEKTVQGGRKYIIRIPDQNNKWFEILMHGASPFYSCTYRHRNR